MALNRPPGPPPLPPGLAAPTGPTAPAMPGQVQRGGREARGRIVAGLGLELLRLAVPMLGQSDEGNEVAAVVAKLGKRFGKPPEDLGQAELHFMGSTLYPQSQQHPMMQGPAIRQRLAAAGLPGAGGG